jgi:hypothetical protein
MRVVAKTTRIVDPGYPFGYPSLNGKFLVTRAKHSATMWDVESGLSLYEIPNSEPKVFGDSGECFVVFDDDKRSLKLIRCPSKEERDVLVAKSREVERIRQAQEDEERQRDQEMQRASAEAKRLAEQEQQAREEERARVLNQRRAQGQCLVCGRSLGVLNRLLGRERHEHCREPSGEAG